LESICYQEETSKRPHFGCKMVIRKIRAIQKGGIVMEQSYIGKKAVIFCLLAFVIVGQFANAEELPSKKNKRQDVLFSVKVNGKYGYIDRSGRIVIEPQFRMPYPLLGELALVILDDRGYQGLIGGLQDLSRFAYIDRTGKCVIEWLGNQDPCYIHYILYHEPLQTPFPVDFGLMNWGGGNLRPVPRWGFVNAQGETVIKGQFKNVSLFCNGFASIQVYATSFRDFLLRDTDKFGFIDESGKIIVQPVYDEVGEFHEGFASVCRGKLYGYVDTTGKLSIPLQFDYASEFSEGLALVGKSEKYGYIDTTGKVKISLNFDRYKIMWRSYPSSFSEGFASIAIGNRCGYIDKAGKTVVKPVFESAGDFSNGLADVVIDGKRGYIDKSGKVIIEPQFEWAGPFNSDGVAIVQIGKKQGCINRSGKILIDPQFDQIVQFVDGIACVRVDQKEGYIDMTGTFVWEPTK